MCCPLMSSIITFFFMDEVNVSGFPVNEVQFRDFPMNDNMFRDFLTLRLISWISDQHIQKPWTSH